MGDFAPPPGPPPPRVPEGWKALWNDQYSEWYYVNIHTKESTWNKPTGPAYLPGDSAPPGAPPGYAPGERTYPAGAAGSHDLTGYPNEKLSTNNPYSHGAPTGSNQNVDEDARYAAKLQAEEDARARAGGHGAERGESDSYYGAAGAGQQGQVPPYGGGPQQPQNYDQQQLPPREQKKSGLGGLLSKLGKGSSSHQPQMGYGGGYPSQHGYVQQGGYPQQGGYGGYPPQQGYGGYPPQGGYGGGYGQPGKKPGGGGLGTAGGAALGLGGGLVGGMLLADAMDNDGGDGGGDYGGDDYGGDDGGGDDGGGGE